MKVLYFSRDYTPHDHRFLSALADSPHQIAFLQLERNGRILESQPLPGGVDPINWRGGKKPALLRDAPGLLSDLARVIRDVNPDVIHAGPVQSAALLTALNGFQPLVTMSWGSDILKDAIRSIWMRWATRFTLRRTTVFLGDCQAVQDRAVSLGFPIERIIQFPWGVDLNHFSPGSSQIRSQLGWTADNFVVLSMRSWEPVYGVDDLVRGFALAAKTFPQLRLLLLAQGSQEDQLRKIIFESKIEDKVHFAGTVSHLGLPDYYRAADLYASASYSDGSSISLLEALACGLPVLLSDIPANCEWVMPGEQGWFFPVGNDQAIARGIRSAVDQRMWLSKMGRASRKIAEERADWRHNFQRLLDAYDLAIKLRQNPKVSG
jgi:glycosyltransferase involved in cell wall biosynthesis